MARRSKNLAAKPVAEADLPHLEDVFDRENWEARMVKARKARENVLTHLDEIGSDDSKKQVKKKAFANETDEPAVSLKKVMETRNLKERLELAQKRHAQVQNISRTADSTSGFTYTRKSTDEFKKVVLNAKAADPKSVPVSAISQTNDGRAARKTLPPLVQDAGIQQNEEPKRRMILGFGLLASGIAAVVLAAVLIGGLPEQTTSVEITGIASPSGELPNLTVGPEVSAQPAALIVPAQSANEGPGDGFPVVAKSTTPEIIAYLGGIETAPQAAAPLPVQSGAVQVTWNVGLGFLPGPAPNQTASVLSVVDIVRPRFPRFSGVGLIETFARPQALTLLPLEYSQVSLSLTAPELIVPLIVDDFDLPGFPVGPVDDRLPITQAIGELFVSLDPSALSQTDVTPTIDTAHPVAKVAAEILIGAGLPAHNIRVFAPADLSENVSGDLVARLEQAGFDVGSLKSVGLRISSNNVRFYHRADAQVALALADMISAKARDFTSFSPRPPQGTVELWMKGSATTSAPAPARRQVARPRNSSNDAALQALRDRLAQRLRSGDHLGGG